MPVPPLVSDRKGGNSADYPHAKYTNRIPEFARNGHPTEVWLLKMCTKPSDSRNCICTKKIQHFSRQNPAESCKIRPPPQQETGPRMNVSDPP
jgi:hypothetical protein